ncbi:hypothetical protein [Neomoorella thermoacetica]|uniref:hypothetical protein n=1 Tax=Neomoorella thermoacetica TaxID=1525 RepID=UPI0032491A66
MIVIENTKKKEQVLSALKQFLQVRSGELDLQMVIYEAGSIYEPRFIRIKQKPITIQYDMLVLDSKGSLIGLFYYFDNDPGTFIKDIIYKAGLLRSFLEEQSRKEGWLPWAVHLFLILDGAKNDEYYKTLHLMNKNSRVLDLVGISSIEYTDNLMQYIQQYIKKENSIRKEVVWDCERFFAPFLFSLRGVGKGDFQGHRQRWRQIVHDELKATFEIGEESDTNYVVPLQLKETIRKNFQKLADELLPKDFGGAAGESLTLKRINKVEIKQFRRLNSLNSCFSEYNVLYGPNGAGKTSLLEALELAITGGVARLDQMKLNPEKRKGILNNPTGDVEITICKTSSTASAGKKTLPLEIGQGNNKYFAVDVFKNFCLSQAGLRDFITSDDPAREGKLLEVTGLTMDVDRVFDNVYEEIKPKIQKGLAVLEGGKVIINKNQLDLTERFFQSVEKVLNPAFLSITNEINKLQIAVGLASEGPGQELRDKIDVLLATIDQMRKVIDEIKSSLKSGEPVAGQQVEWLEQLKGEAMGVLDDLVPYKQRLSQVLHDIGPLEAALKQKLGQKPGEKPNRQRETLQQKIAQKEEERNIARRLYKAVLDYLEAVSAYEKAVKAINQFRKAMEDSLRDRDTVSQIDIKDELRQQFEQVWGQLTVAEKEFPVLAPLAVPGGDYAYNFERAENQLREIISRVEEELSSLKQLISKTPVTTSEKLDEEANKLLEELKPWLHIDELTDDYAGRLVESTRIVDLRNLSRKLDELTRSVIITVDLDELKQLLVHYFDPPQDSDEQFAGTCYWLYKWKLMHDKKAGVQEAFGRAFNKIIQDDVETVFREILWALTAVSWTYPVPLMEKTSGKNAGISLKVQGPDGPLNAIYNTAEQNLVCLAWFFTAYLYLGSIKSKVLILDDPFQSLDDINLNNFVRNLDRLLHFVGAEQVIISLHQPAIAEYMFEIQAQQKPPADQQDEGVSLLSLWRKEKLASDIAPVMRARRKPLSLEGLKKHLDPMFQGSFWRDAVGR